jgi:hypothetical protein
MQLIESIEIISHSNNLDSKNTRRQTKQLAWWFIYQSSESPPVISTSPLRKLELLTRPTSSRVSFNRFSHFTSSYSFLSEVKQTFINFFKTYHTLESSRTTPSRLGGFTSKSNKWHKDCFTKIKCASAHKEDSLNPPLMTSHKSQYPHKEGLGRAHKGLGWIYFMGSTSTLQRRERESFYTCPQKTSCWKLSSKNRNIRFW